MQATNYSATMLGMGSLSLSAACVVTNSEDKILLIKRADNGQWQIPGGVVELGESPLEAAIRETQEESGITPVNLILTGIYTNVARGVVCHVFAADYGSGEPTRSEESVAAQFDSLETALAKVPTTFTHRISDAVDCGSDVVFRSHDGEQWLPQ